MKKATRKFFKKQWRKWVLVLCLPLGTGIVSGCGCSKSNNCTINLSGIKTPRSFFKAINNYVHFQMPESAAILGYPNNHTSQPPLSTEQVNTILTYLKGIQDETFLIKFGSQTLSLPIDLTQYTNKIITSIKNDSRTNSEKHAVMNKREEELASSGIQPNIVAYIGYVSLPLGMQMSGFASFPDVAWENYINELKYLHEVFWKIVTSQVYKGWINDKMFYLPKGPLAKYDLSTGKFKTTSMFKWKPGKYFDNKVNFTIPLPNKPKEISNLGAEFGFLINDIIP